MACGACAKNRARRQQQLAARRERLAQKEQEKIARAAAAQAALRASAPEVAKPKKVTTKEKVKKTESLE
jgi:hypothetical protein